MTNIKFNPFVNIFSVNLARGLRNRGVDARILLTEDHTMLVTIGDAPMERPDDIPFVNLPVDAEKSWGAHWGGMIAYLENQAPCIYIPNSDWRHSSVSPLLSDEVFVVGIVHSDDPLHYDHVVRLGRHWNAIVTTSNHIAAKTLLLDESLRERLSTIPIGVHIPSLETLRNDRSLQRPLRVIYHGVLKQQQKRILDLALIVALAVERDVNITLTIAGGGPDEVLLRTACEKLVAMERITFLGVVPHDKLLPLLEEHDAYLLTSEFEGMPNALLEAMGRGCIPVVSDIVSAIPELIRQGENGYILPVGDIEGFVNRLDCLQRSPELRKVMARQAFVSVSSGRYGVDDMVCSYLDLFTAITAGRAPYDFHRSRGELNHPPTQVAGIELLPIQYLHHEEGLGSFPNRFVDYYEFRNELRKIQRPAGTLLQELTVSECCDLSGVTVIIGVPAWISSGLNDFSVALARGLSAEKLTVQILLTEEESNLVTELAPRIPQPVDINFVRLPVSKNTGWGGHWGAIIRYLEENAPCVYIPNHDWRHSCVTPLLSNRVAVVGIVYGGDPFHEDHLRRLGKYWDSIVTFSDVHAANLLNSDHLLGMRLALIYPGVDGWIPRFVALFQQLFDSNRHCIYQRPDGVMNLPPAQIEGIGVFPVSCHHLDEDVGILPSRDTDVYEFYAQVAVIGTHTHSRVKRFIEKMSFHSKVQDVLVFSQRDYLIFTVLTCSYVAAVTWFFAGWFTMAGWLDHLFLYGMITVMILVTTINKIGRWLLLPLMRRPLPMPPPAGLKTAVITTFVKRFESLEMLEATIRGMINLQYPHDTWVLDEDDDDEVKQVCATLGARHFSRKNNPVFQTEEGLFKSCSKHGNINSWLHAVGFTSYEYLVSFDPDHIPEKSFLDRTLGYFIDPDVGYVQAPQQYYNQSSSIVARGAAEETYDYFSCIQMAAYGMGYPIILGAHNSHRMKALQQVGGFAPHDADDLMLTALYRNAGWKGVYVPELLAYGLTPVDWTSYLRQQRRWARSVIDLKLWHYPSISRNLSLRSQSMSFLHGLNYFHKSFIIALALALLLCMLACGTPPEAFPAIVVTKFAFVLLLLQVLELWRQKFYLDKTTERGIHWRAGLMHMAKWPVMLLALYDALTRRRFSYETTSKVRSSRGRSGIIRQSFLIIFLTMAASLAGAGSAGPVSPLLYLTAFCVIVGSALLIVTELNGFPEPFQKKMHLKKDNS